MTAPETEIRGQLRQRLKNRLDGAIIQCGSGRRFARPPTERWPFGITRLSGCPVATGASAANRTSIRSVIPPRPKGMYSAGNREGGISSWTMRVLAQLYRTYIHHDLGGRQGRPRGGEAGVALDAEQAWRFPTCSCRSNH